MKEITNNFYTDLKEIYQNAESYSKEEFIKIILEHVYCKEAYDELLEMNICPDCKDGKLELVKVNGHTYEAWGREEVQDSYIKQCENCGMTFE